jgi:hypothetical protein
VNSASCRSEPTLLALIVAAQQYPRIPVVSDAVSNSDPVPRAGVRHSSLQYHQGEKRDLIISFHAYQIEILRCLGGAGEARRLDQGLRGVGAV